MKVNEQSGVEQKQPLVSVIMPAYNAEEYISEAVQSVMAQTYTNWELLILDDCSTDGTADKARCFSDLDPRITLYSNPKNIGVALTRNKGMALAKGSWVALLDSDDIWHKDKLEKQLVAAENTGADIIYCSYSLMDKNGEHLSDFIVPERTSYELGDGKEYLFYYVDNVRQINTGLVQLDDGSYIYVRSGANLAIGDYYVTKTNGLLPNGVYTFGDDGKMIINP